MLHVPKCGFSLYVISPCNSAQKMKFSIKDFYSKCERNLKTEEILNGKLHFSVQCNSVPLKENKGQGKPGFRHSLLSGCLWY